MRQIPISPLYLPASPVCLPISPLHLPYSSPTSPLHLLHLEHAAGGAERGEAERGVAIRQQQQLDQHCCTAARDEPHLLGVEVGVGLGIGIGIDLGLGLGLGVGVGLEERCTLGACSQSRHISPISPHISPTSPLYLRYISPSASRWKRGRRGATSPLYLPISTPYLPYISAISP